MVTLRRGALVYVHSATCKTCGVVVFHTPMVNWLGGTSALSICAFCYMSNVFGVVVFHTSVVNWRRRALVYVHSAICETYLL